MRFRVLGPIEVETDSGSPVVLKGRKETSLLAIMLCFPNQVLSTDRLIDLLWADDSPRTVRNALQTYVSRVRRALGDEGRITRTVLGYRLVVEPGELDAQTFEDIAAESRKAGANGEPDKATELCAQALALWQGEAFSGLEDVAVVRQTGARLNEARLAMLEDRIDADLVLGCHTRLVAELTSLAARYPLQERLRAQLMHALHRSGRQVDALLAYQDFRTTLRTELGLEPSAELRDLETAILRDDPSLRPPAAVSCPLQIPAELPMRTPAFVGRRAELSRLRGMLTGESRIATIDGLGGVGKSALAVHFAHTVLDRFPDGQLYANLQGTKPGVEPPSAHRVLARFLRSLDPNVAVPDDLDEAAARFRTITAPLRLLIVLDDVVETAQVEPLLPSGPNCAVLITSRRTLTNLDGAMRLHLDVLDEPTAVDLLSKLVGGDLTSRHPDAASRIVRICGRLPLAIRISGARIAGRPDWSLDGFVRRLTHARCPLDELRHGDLAVRDCFRASTEQLRQDARGGRALEIFALLGLLDTPAVTVETANVLAAGVADETRNALDLLTEVKLLHGLPAARYGMHDLVRLYSKELATTRLSEASRTA